MEPKKTYFLSDLHLIDDQDEKSLRLLRALETLSPRAERWVLLGDIFDSWIADHDYFLQKHSKVVSKLLELCRSGIEIHFFEGNHDLHLKEFWEVRHGIQVHPERANFEWHGKRVRCEHGDLMNPEDKNYLRLRHFLRRPFVRRGIFALPGTFVGAVAEGWSATSRKRTSKSSPERTERIRKMMHTYAIKEAAGRSFDYLITGHTHTRDEFVIPGSAAIFLNLGTWLEKPQVLELDSRSHRFIDV